MTDLATCPACGAQNHCALANATTGPCWCFVVKVNPATLEALAPSDRGRACLCARCAQGPAQPPALPAEADDAG